MINVASPAQFLKATHYGSQPWSVTSKTPVAGGSLQLLVYSAYKFASMTFGYRGGMAQVSYRVSSIITSLGQLTKGGERLDLKGNDELNN
jgi:hypothetical protein